MQKLEKQEHSHKFTNILKGIIFAIVMLAPFFAVAIKCLYVTNNDNANQSYSGTTQNEINIDYKYQSNEVNNINDLVEGNIYYLDNIFFDFNQSSFQGEFTIKLLQFDTFSINFGEQSVDDFYPSQLSNGYEYGLYINLYDTGDCYINFNLSEDCYCNLLTEQVLTIDITSCVFKIYPQLQGFKYFLQDAQLSLPQYTDYNVIENVEIIEGNDTLDNVFQYSINQLNEMPIFNWVKNTGIYTPISNMTNGLGFDNDNNPLALLLAYWSLNTAIYIVFDIIIWCFTKLTHFMIDTD